MLGITHVDLSLVCGCSAMETHFMELPTNSSCADVASRGSLDLGSECCKRGQIILTRFTRETHTHTQRAGPAVATLKFTELLSTSHSTANVCLWRLRGCVLDFINLSATGLAEITKSTHLKGCPHTFVDVVYLCPPEVHQPELMLTTTRGQATVAGPDSSQEYAFQVLVLNDTLVKVINKETFHQ